MRFTKKINGNTFEFINEGFSNSRNWGHKTKLYRNDSIYPVAENKSIYLNRTWESYRFQSCMRGCVYNLIDSRKEVLKSEYKDNNNIKRMTKKHNELFNELLSKDDELIILNLLKDSL